MKAVLVLSRKLSADSMIYFTPYEDLFRSHGIEFTRVYGDTEEEILAEAQGAEILLDMLQPITAKILRGLPRLKAVIRSGIGVNNIDVATATELGIMVCNSPDHCIQEVANLATTHLLNAVTLLSQYGALVHAGKWQILPPPHRISSMTLGLIGFGNIARLVSRRIQAFGSKVVAYDPFLPDSIFQEFQVEKVELDALYARADMISIHVPLFPETMHMLNQEAFEKMKDGVVIVNTARGPLICEEDLIAALKSGKVGAAGLDVFESEPITSPEHPLASLPNVCCTPHVGYRGVEAFAELEEKMAQCVVTLAKGELPYNCVNKKQLAK